MRPRFLCRIEIAIFLLYFQQYRTRHRHAFRKTKSPNIKLTHYARLQGKDTKLNQADEKSKLQGGKKNNNTRI